MQLSINTYGTVAPRSSLQNFFRPDATDLQLTHSTCVQVSEINVILESYVYSSLTLSKNLVQATYSTCSLIYYWFNIKIINSCNKIFLLQKKHTNFVHNLKEPLGYKCIKIWFQEFQQLSIFLKIENILHGHAVSTEQKTTCTKLKQYRMYDNVWKLRLFYWSITVVERLKNHQE